jgi:hypothetical protein
VVDVSCRSFSLCVCVSVLYFLLCSSVFERIILLDFVRGRTLLSTFWRGVPCGVGHSTDTLLSASVRKCVSESGVCVCLVCVCVSNHVTTSFSSLFLVLFCFGAFFGGVCCLGVRAMSRMMDEDGEDAHCPLRVVCACVRARARAVWWMEALMMFLCGACFW